MFRNIRWRIAIPYVVLILLAMTGLVVYLSDLVRDAHMTDLQAQLTAEAGEAIERMDRGDRAQSSIVIDVE